MSQVCYKQIEGDYWYGWYLDLRIVINKQTGYVNASKLCTDHKKQFHHWTQNNQTKKLIQAFSSEQIANYAGPTEFRGSRTTNKK